MTITERVAPKLPALLVLSLVAGCMSLPPRHARPLPPEAIRPVLAVSSFENRSNFKGQWKLGSGMADLLTSELLCSENFVLVERQHLQKVIGEIDMQRNERFRYEGRTDTGRLKNAQYLVRGVINDFSQVGGGSVFVALRSLFLGGSGHTARVALTLTIVDVESGQIVDSVQCAGKARARQAYGKARYKDVNFGGDAFFKTPLGTATRDAIRRGVRGLTEKMPREHWEPMVADVLQGGHVLINGGTDRGVKAGTVYNVQTTGRKVTDPVTGDLLSVIPGALIGRIEVTTVDERISHAKIVQGAGIARGHHLIPRR